MSEILPEQEVRIDRESKLILQALRGGGWMRALKLRRAAELGENRQVFYRMEKYLMPAGLVEEKARESSEELREFRLTRSGGKWVEEQGEELLEPTTREEIREYAFEGYKAGTSAQDSVQKYRKKLHRVKTRVDDVREEVGEIADQQESDDRTLDILWQRSDDNRDRSKENRTRVATVEEDVETRASVEGVDELRESMSGAEQRLARIEAKQKGTIRKQAEVERTRARLRRLAKPAGYLVVAAVVAYLVVVVAVAFVASELLTGVVLAGIGALLGVALGIGVAIYAYGGNVTETYRTIREEPASETAE